MSPDQAVARLEPRYPIEARWQRGSASWMRPLDAAAEGSRRVRLFRQDRRGFGVRATLRLDQSDSGSTLLTGSIGPSWMARLLLASLFGGAIVVVAVAAAHPSEWWWVLLGVVLFAALWQITYRQAMGIRADLVQSLDTPIHTGGTSGSDRR